MVNEMEEMEKSQAGGGTPNMLNCRSQISLRRTFAHMTVPSSLVLSFRAVVEDGFVLPVLLALAVAVLPGSGEARLVISREMFLATL